jgi:putative sigma-54 modulation protein
MKVEITGRRVVITPAIRAHINNKLRKFTKILGDDINFHVILDVEKERHTAEILLKSKLLDLAGKSRTEDMYNSIMRAIEKIERQALKQKSKIVNVSRQRAKAKSVDEKLGVKDPSSRSLARKSPAVREETVQKKPMSVDEALIEINQSEDPFLVFRNSVSGDINVLYRRKDGSLRLVRN